MAILHTRLVTLLNAPAANTVTDELRLAGGGTPTDPSLP